MAEVFETEGDLGHQPACAAGSRAIPSIIRLFTGDRTGPAMEAVFIERLQAAVEAVAEKDGGEVADACHAHWHELGQRVKAAIGVDLNAADPDRRNPRRRAKKRFVSRLGRAARQGIGNLKVRNQLDKELRRRNLALKSFVFMTLVLTIAGATCGALGVPWLPAILCGLAALFLTGGAGHRLGHPQVHHPRVSNTACSIPAAPLPAPCTRDYEEALRIVFRDYAASLANVRTHLAREKLAIEPRLRRWQELFLTLKAIEQDL